MTTPPEIRPDIRPDIRLAVLDMAGTTVRDGGIVESSFLLALESVGIPRDDPAMPGRLEYVQATMGQSKIEVFRGLLDDDGWRVRLSAERVASRPPAARDDAGTPHDPDARAGAASQFA